MSKIKWFNNGSKEIQVQENEKVPDGFVRGRLKRKPTAIDSLTSKFSKEFLYRRYIIDNVSFKDLFEELEVNRYELRMLIKHYGFKKTHKDAHKNNLYKRSHEESVVVGKKSSETQKKNWSMKSSSEKELWSDRCRQTEKNLPKEIVDKKSKKYKDYWNSLTDKEKSEINKKKSESCKDTWEKNGDDISMRMKQTYKKNKTGRLCRTLAEQKMYDALVKRFKNVVYDDKIDSRYPYFVDFYLPESDIFIELNAHPSHGRLPMDYMSVDEYSKYPSGWADVFAKRDVAKYKSAVDNKLKYIRIYPSATLEENVKVNKDYKELTIFLYKTQH